MSTPTTAAVLHASGSIAVDRLHIEARELRPLGPGEVLVAVRACGVCRTDLHIVEGELPPRGATIVPGHQIVGIVTAAAPGVDISLGTRVGISWLGGVDGTCRFCREGGENLCDAPVFTGYDVDGGYAQSVIARADFVYPLDERLDDLHAAPLLCAGIIGFRALRVAGVQPGEHVGAAADPGVGRLAAGGERQAEQRAAGNASQATGYAAARGCRTRFTTQ